MSLTSKELNYLIWRYFQETGYDLSAYTFDRQSQCSSYENDDNFKIIEKIQPGCLVELVQKGILYTIAEAEAKEDSDYTFLGSLVQNELKSIENNIGGHSSSQIVDQARFKLKNETSVNGLENDVDMHDANGKEPIHRSHANNGDKQDSRDFETRQMSPQISFLPSVNASWNPDGQAFAYSRCDGKATLSTIRQGAVVESIQLSHPDILNVKNEINVVSWAPSGDLIVTAGAFSELRAWSPQGRLKNIANAFVEDLRQEAKKTIVINLYWSPSGRFVMTVDSENVMSIFDGSTLSLIGQLKNETDANNSPLSAVAWLTDDKFAISSTNNTIKINDIKPPPFGAGLYEVHTLGTLLGHDNPISLLSLNSHNEAKLLASCSDFDYEIKVWSSASSQTSLNLNVRLEKQPFCKLHNAPIIDLEWIPAKSRNILLSVSMDAVLNIWDADTGDVIKSTELFRSKNNFSEHERSLVNKDALVLISALAPSGELLAIGDDLGKITIWDVTQQKSPREKAEEDKEKERKGRYEKKKEKNLVKCVGIYAPPIPESTQDDSTRGLCDLKWDTQSRKLIASYVGLDSVLIDALATIGE
ncbi:uncharacterized protein LODBEIA_P42740 [Lodderomyces beijingensis]|uniref:LisH domain-containing protein n=1 Tax=Lodderomyces beijingensis TaxID=1775926 RepID=A0ABP0ZV19_9ASCO